MTLRVSLGRRSASAGKSHSCVTATTRSPRPRANSDSVADGTRLAIRMGLTMTRAQGEIWGMDLLPDSEIGNRLGELDGWSRDGDVIKKEFKNGDFVGSVKFVDALVEPAEDMNHHPDLELSWDSVTVSIANHAAGGLTETDFELAKRVDAIASR